MVNGKKFIENPESIQNIAPVINYFARDNDFFKCSNLVTDYNQPSFEKSLLLMGQYGNGKTSIMNALGVMFNHFVMPMRYHSVNARDLVTEWEAIENNGGKHLFFERYTCQSLYIDDVKKERVAYNFGKVEIIRDVLEKRYDKKLTTHITCNFPNGDTRGSVEQGLKEFNRYGDHIYDRIFEMCNIVVFTGESFR